MSSEKKMSASGIIDALKRMPTDFGFVDKTGVEHPMNLELLIGWSDYFRNVVRDERKIYRIDVAPELVNHLCEYLYGAELNIMEFANALDFKDLFIMYDNAKLMMLDEYEKFIYSVLFTSFDGSVEFFFMAAERDMKLLSDQSIVIILSALSVSQPGARDPLFYKNMKSSIQNLSPEQSKQLLLKMTNI